jgi:hypothetical protein
VYDVGEDRVGDKLWFDTLYKDLEDGGTRQFLYLLLNLRLGNWHPRQILKTSESIEQERMSGDTVAQWSQACIDADELVGGEFPKQLGRPLSAEDLREAYNGFCRQNGQRPLSTEAFGKACTEMFGLRQRLKALECDFGGGQKRRPWGYDVPSGGEWQKALDTRLGIATEGRR